MSMGQSSFDQEKQTNRKISSLKHPRSRHRISLAEVTSRLALVWASLVAQLVKNPPAMWETWVRSLDWEDKQTNKQKDKLSKAPTKQTQDFPSRDNWPLSPCLGFPGGSAGKESTCNVGDLGLIPEFGRSPGEGHGYLLQYSGLENFIDCIVLGVAKHRTQLSDFYFT